MSIEDGGLVKAYCEDVIDESDDLCVHCNDLAWERLIGQYARGTCWVIYCGNCGKLVQKKWTMLP